MLVAAHVQRTERLSERECVSLWLQLHTFIFGFFPKAAVYGVPVAKGSELLMAALDVSVCVTGGTSV